MPWIYSSPGVYLWKFGMGDTPMQETDTTIEAFDTADATASLYDTLPDHPGRERMFFFDPPLPIKGYKPGNRTNPRPYIDFNLIGKFSMGEHPIDDFSTTYTTLGGERSWRIVIFGGPCLAKTMVIGMDKEKAPWIDVKTRWKRAYRCSSPELVRLPHSLEKRPVVNTTFFTKQHGKTIGKLSFKAQKYDEDRGYRMLFSYSDFQCWRKMALNAGFMDIEFFPTAHDSPDTPLSQQSACYNLEGLPTAFYELKAAGYYIPEAPW